MITAPKTAFLSKAWIFDIMKTREYTRDTI